MEELYHRYRPTTFADVLGAKDTAAALAAYVAKGTVPHFILFHGPSGTGKTTLARILKDELECGDLDYKEINSANNRGIDTIRDLQSWMRNGAAAGKVKVCLIDECHMATGEAQQAALKMTEDTPKHVYFFFCTTNPEKLNKALVSRACPMPVRAIPEDELLGLVERVAKKEKILLHPEAPEAIVKAAQGSARVALVVLDKLAVMPVAEQKGAVGEIAAAETEAYDLCKALIDKAKWVVVAKILTNLKSEPEQARRAVLGYARKVLLGNGPKAYHAYVVIECLSKNLYDTGAAGLALQCYDAVNYSDK